MDQEQKDALLKAISEGSKRKLKKSKKDDLLEVITEVLDKRDEDNKKNQAIIENLKEEIQIKDSIIENHTNIDNLLKDYQDLVEEIKQKYETEKDLSLASQLKLEKLAKINERFKILGLVLVILLFLSIIL